MTALRLRRPRGDRGDFALELAILAPVIILMFIFVWEAGQLINAQSKIEGISRDGAREATSGATLDQTAAMVSAQLARTPYTCDPPTVTPKAAEVGTNTPSQYITVYVSCNLGLIGGFSKEVHASATSKTDPYRSNPIGGAG